MSDVLLPANATPQAIRCGLAAKAWIDSLHYLRNHAQQEPATFAGLPIVQDGLIDFWTIQLLGEGGVILQEVTLAH